MKYLLIAVLIIAFAVYCRRQGQKNGPKEQNSPARPQAVKAAATVNPEEERVIINGIDYTPVYHRDVAYFAPIIKNNFGTEYDIEEHVPLGRIVRGATGIYKAADFLLKKDGRPVLVIDIAYKSGHPKGKEACNKRDIKHVTMYGVYENKESYVVERIKKALNS